MDNEKRGRKLTPNEIAKLEREWELLGGAGPLTPDQIAKIEKERARLTALIENLSPEQSEAWLDAHGDDIETRLETLMQERSDFVAVRQSVAAIIQEHPNMAFGEALEFIRQKDKKTLPEAEALDAFERIKPLLPAIR